MRKLGAALSGLPVVLIVWVLAVAERARRRPALAVIGVVIVGTLVLAALTRPAPSVATVPSVPQPVSAALLDPVTTGHALQAPFVVAFDAAMDPASVAAALRISPEAAVSFSWDAAGRTLTIAPVSGWTSGTLYTITIDASARAAGGAALSAPVRAVVLTAGTATATIAATRPSGSLVSVGTAFMIRADHPTTAAAVQAALQTTPAIVGTVTAGTTSGTFIFTPTAPLAAGSTYVVTLQGLADVNGLAFDPAPTLQVSTVGAPAVVRFRPVKGSTGVALTAILSVRFTDRMDRTSTATAFSVSVNGKVVAGKVEWTENDTVLVFTPKVALPYSASVTMDVAAGAHSRAGGLIAADAKVTFTTVAKPKPPTAKAPKPVPIVHSGGSGAVAGTWAAVESYYLTLMNCTRTGGLVTSTATCSSPGGRNVAPLVINPQISAKVTRPYAKYLAVHAACDHYLDGTPGFRLARAGFTSYRWGENIGCGNGNPFKAMLADHLFFQAERLQNVGVISHYGNIMNAQFSQVGIGVWVSGGLVRLVVDFYHP